MVWQFTGQCLSSCSGTVGGFVYVCRGCLFLNGVNVCYLRLTAYHLNHLALIRQLLNISTSQLSTLLVTSLDLAYISLRKLEPYIFITTERWRTTRRMYCFTQHLIKKILLVKLLEDQKGAKQMHERKKIPTNSYTIYCAKST